MKVCLVCSHGGHLSELRQLSDAWVGSESFWITYRSPVTNDLPRSYLLRNVGTNPARMIVAAAQIAWILIRERPDVLISTGSELAIPAFYIARLLGIRTIFIEVWTRVQRPTGTGRLVYPVANHFFVQWPQLKARYGRRAKYEGTLL